MIYLDNAATTMHKPQVVIDAVCGAMTSFGGPGRGSHQAALDASMAVFGARQAVSDLLDAFSIDGEKLLILLVMWVIFNERSDNKTLLLALGYLLL